MTEIIEDDFIDDDDYTYRGNENLKKPGTKINFTPEMVQEILKCKDDPVYFSEKYVKAITLNDGFVNIKLHDFQKEVVESYLNNKRTAVLTSRQVGKALPLTEDILTPNGFKKFGDIEIGDIVYGKDGKETKVTFVTDVMYDHTCLKIKFDDGSEIVSDENHLWTVNSNILKKETTVNTKQLSDLLIKHKKYGQGLYIEINKALEYSKKELPVDAYILGLWLGDGHSENARITSHRDDYEFYSSILEDCNEFKLDKRTKHTGYFKIDHLFRSLRLNEILNNKHIPNIYKFSSVEDRLELLRGLLDSDGSISKKGLIEFYQKNEEIMDDVIFILRSLGIKVKKVSKILNNQTYFTARFYTDEYEMFKLPRKLDRQKTHSYSKILNKRIYISDIISSKSVPVKCIQVDNEDHLFLIGKNLIPTHNTTIATCIILHYILFSETVKVAILANKQESAIEVMERIQLAYEALPLWLQQGVIGWNKKKINLENKSSVIAAATSSSSIRGKAVNFLYIDEAAHVENWDEFYASTYPVISSGKNSKVLMTTTPLGMNHFYKIWEDAIKGPHDESWNGFHPIKVLWHEVPGRDESWKRDQLQALNFDTQKFDQEFNCEFFGSSGTLISGETLKSLVHKNPIHKDAIGMFQYEKAEKDNTYVIVCDVSRGKGLDYSTFHVINVSQVPYKQVCVFRSNLILTTDFADIIHYTAMNYNKAYVLVENNDIGAEVPNILHHAHEYENILYTDSNGRSGKILSFGGKTAERGIRTTTSTKAHGCSMIKALIEEKKLLINDFETISEFSTFSKKGNSYAAEEGKHDDLVMPLVIFGWLSTQPYFKELTNNDIMQQLKSQTIEEIEKKFIPFGFIINGIDDAETDFDILERNFFFMD